MSQGSWKSSSDGKMSVRAAVFLDHPTGTDTGMGEGGGSFEGMQGVVGFGGGGRVIGVCVSLGDPVVCGCGWVCWPWWWGTGKGNVAAGAEERWGMRFGRKSKPH